MSTLTKSILEGLKAKLPTTPYPKIIDKHRMLHDQDVSERTIKRFFKGDTYTTELHQTIISVIEDQSNLINKSILIAES